MTTQVILCHAKTAHPIVIVAQVITNCKIFIAIESGVSSQYSRLSAHLVYSATIRLFLLIVYSKGTCADIDANTANTLFLRKIQKLIIDVFFTTTNCLYEDRASCDNF